MFERVQVIAYKAISEEVKLGIAKHSRDVLVLAVIYRSDFIGQLSGAAVPNLRLSCRWEFSS